MPSSSKEREGYLHPFRSDGGREDAGQSPFRSSSHAYLASDMTFASLAAIIGKNRAAMNGWFWFRTGGKSFVRFKIVMPGKPTEDGLERVRSSLQKISPSSIAIFTFRRGGWTNHRPAGNRERNSARPKEVASKHQTGIDATIRNLQGGNSYPRCPG